MTDNPDTRPERTPANAQRVLVLQGGGALGSYQAGAYQALCHCGFKPEWIAGISIGAVNAAIIAGNVPEKRVDRLKEFYVVESSYLRMFLVLGGLGLLLGSAGMGILVLRHVMERRGELALLRAVGYSTEQAARVVMAEHRFLVVSGLLAGTAASALAIGPSALQPQNHLPFGLLALLSGRKPTMCRQCGFAWNG